MIRRLQFKSMNACLVLMMKRGHVLCVVSEVMDGGGDRVLSDEERVD